MVLFITVLAGLFFWRLSPLSFFLFIYYFFFAAQEIFGPILTVYVYPEKRYKEVVELIDTTTPYGLTGAVFAQEK